MDTPRTEPQGVEPGSVGLADPVVDAMADPAPAPGAAAASSRRHWGLLPGRPFSGTRRWFLWVALVVLIVALLGMLMWLAARYEATQVQDRLERDVASAAADIRAGLARDAQSLQALFTPTSQSPDIWEQYAMSLLRDSRELVRVEWRDLQVQPLAFVDSPYRAPVFERLGREDVQTDLQTACANARRSGGVAYVPSYFVPQPDGMGFEVLEMCLPVTVGGETTGYVVASYSLSDLLAEMVSRDLLHSRDVSLVEADGTRLAFQGTARRGSQAFAATQVLELPGMALVLRLESWRDQPRYFPNFLTAMVAAMTVALASVLLLLGRDTRRRLRVEQRLADALAFRKAMEDSLVTGLRARDLEGRTTYVNPAFCQMVGFSAQELMLPTAVAPYWPPEVADEFKRRLGVRPLQVMPRREGVESTFMRRDGTRFPVLIFEAPLINAQGVQTGWMSAFLDISEQRRVEELARATQERLQATARLAAIGEMASLLSHELNQPLAAISSYATGSLNMLQPDWYDSGRAPPVDLSESARVATAHRQLQQQAERHQLLEVAMRQISEQAQRAGKVIRSVHDFVRRREAREAVDPRVLFESVMPLVTMRSQKHRIRVCCEFEEALPQVHCDRTMVEQVLLNLTRNAMQAMENVPIADRELVLGLRRAVAGADTYAMPGWVEFSVADAGVGVPPDLAERIFTPFFTTKREGMGLGLGLCRTVVEQHGGVLEFENNTPRGTVFRFTLPLATSVRQSS